MIADLLRKGHQKLKDQEVAEEASKKGTLRGGSVGCVTANGTIIGKCHRISLLRFLGIHSPKESITELMFAAGRTNEDSWLRVLKAAWEGVILREEEIQIKWKTEAGVSVTGRPDIVLCREEKDDFVVDEDYRDSWSQMDPHRPEVGDIIPAIKNVPVRGLELKLISAIWTMVSVLLEGKPKTDHLIQAAHYQWQLGVPFELWYTSRVHWPIVGWMAKFFKSLGFLKDVVFQEELLERGDKGDVKKVLPFYAGFELDIQGGVLYYRSVASEEWVQTLITVDGIKRYYELVGQMPSTKDLGDRPSRTTALGEDMGYNPCDSKYCPFAEVCNKHERNYDDWVGAAYEESKK